MPKHRSKGRENVGRITGERNGAIAALQIAAREVVTLTGSEIRKRVEMRCPAWILFRKPNLVAPQIGRAEQVGIVCGATS